MKRPRVQRGLEASQFAAALPPQYRKRIPPNLARTAGTFTLLLFRHEREDVVISSTVRHALQAIEDTKEQIIAVGGNFTAEARAILEAAGVTILRLSDFHWTDESYKHVGAVPKVEA